MFDIQRFKSLAQNGLRFGLSAGENQEILKGLAAVTVEEVADFKTTFPAEPAEVDPAAVEREKVRVADGKLAAKEIEKEKEEKPHLHIPRDPKTGDILRAPTDEEITAKERAEKAKAPKGKEK